MKDFLESRNVRNLYSAKDTTHEAFRTVLIENMEVGMNMIQNRNLTCQFFVTSVTPISVSIYCAHGSLCIMKRIGNERD